MLTMGNIRIFLVYILIVIVNVLYNFYVSMLILPNKNQSINLKLVDDDDGRTGGQTPRVPANCPGDLKCLPMITTFSLYHRKVGFIRGHVSRMLS